MYLKSVCLNIKKKEKYLCWRDDQIGFTYSSAPVVFLVKTVFHRSGISQDWSGMNKILPNVNSVAPGRFLCPHHSILLLYMAICAWKSPAKPESLMDTVDICGLCGKYIVLFR